MSLVADAWIEDVLTGITGCTGVFEGLAPTEQPYPFIVYQTQVPRDVNGVGPDARIMHDDIYIIRVINRRNDWHGLTGYISQEIDNRIDGQSAVVDATYIVDGQTVPVVGEVLATERQSEYRLIEQLQGRQVRHLGGSYRVQTTGS